MEFTTTELEGVLVFHPEVFEDERGSFFESFVLDDFQDIVNNTVFVQENETYNRYGTVRGLHWQCAPYTQAKLIRVVYGTILDVALDIRRQSPTCGKHVSVELSGENKKQLFIPKGFAHGFAVLSKEAVVQYKCDNYYYPTCERGFRYNDHRLCIDWKLPRKDVILSLKDEKYTLYNERMLL